MSKIMQTLRNVVTHYLVSPGNTRNWGLTVNTWIDKENLDLFSDEEKGDKGYYDHRDEDV